MKRNNHKIPTKLPMDSTNLKERRRKFVKEYMTNGFNCYKAYEAAGYKPSKASAEAMLEKEEVKKIIATYHKQKLQKLNIEHNDIVLELKNIADTTVGDIYKTWTELKNFDDLTYDQKKAIKGIETRSVTNSRGETIDYVKIQFYDRMEALKELGKHTGFYNADTSQKQVQNVQINVLSDELQVKLNEE